MSHLRRLSMFLLFALVAIRSAAADQLVVTSPAANVMSGRDVVGRVSQGWLFEVLETRGAWHRVQLTEQGQAKSGWIADKDIRLLSGITPEQLDALAQATSKHASRLYAANKFEEALPWAEQMVPLFAKAYGAEDSRVAGTYRFLTLILVELGRTKEALETGERSAALYEKSLGAHELTGRMHRNLGNILGRLEEYDKAEEHLARAEQIYRTLPDVNPSDLGWLKMDRGRIAAERFKFDEAKTLYLSALETLRKSDGEESVGTATVYLNLGNLSEMIDDHALAHSYFKKSLDIHLKIGGRNNANTADAYQSLGRAAMQIGNLLEAKDHFQQALQIRQTVSGLEHPATAIAYNHLAVLYKDMGDFKAAKAAYEKAIELRVKLAGEHHPSTAGTRLNYASVLSKDDFEEAKSLANQAMQDMEDFYGENHPLVAFAADVVGNLQGSDGDYQAALQTHRRALAIRREHFGENSLSTAVSYHNVGNYLVKTGKLAEAKQSFEKANAIYQRLAGSNHPDTLRTVVNGAYVSLLMGDLTAAEDHHLRYQQGLRHVLARVLPGLDVSAQLKFLAKDSQDTVLSYGVRHADRPSAVEVSALAILNHKGVAQEALASSALLAREAKTPELSALISQLEQVRSQLARESLRSVSEEESESHQQLLAQLTSQELQLSGKVGAAGLDVKLPAEWIELDSVRQRLNASEVLVEIVRFELVDFIKDESAGTHYAAWIIPSAGQGNPVVVDLGLAEKIEAAVASARQQLEAAPTRISEIGEVEATRQANLALCEVAQLVLDPLLPHLGQAEQLTLSPDGTLWLIPWGAMPLADGKLAVEKFQINHVVSGRDLLLEPTKATVTAPLVLADPDFDATGGVSNVTAEQESSETRRRSVGTLAELPRVPRLPGTLIEARAILPNLKIAAGTDPEFHAGAAANEQAFKSAHNPYMVCLSTHGFFLADQSDEAVSGVQFQNPLLRSGLLLAGCNRCQEAAADEDDGVLTALEIVGTDLRGTKLVVLSACETGLGEIQNGQGVAGLRQAFQLAGAESVVASLWQVPDLDTAHLMKSFFEELAAGSSKPAALRAAQLQRIEQRRQRYGAAHPYFWAAFTLTGND